MKNLTKILTLSLGLFAGCANMNNRKPVQNYPESEYPGYYLFDSGTNTYDKIEYGKITEKGVRLKDYFENLPQISFEVDSVRTDSLK